MTTGEGGEDSEAYYRHEETDERVQEQTLVHHLNSGEWDGEPISPDSSEAWRITAPAEKAGIWWKEE